MTDLAAAAAAFDVDRFRRETPGCARVLHFDSAGSSLPPQPVVEATIAHLQLEAEVGGYEAEARAAPAIERTYRSVARLLNARPNEIALVENATRAWDMAFYAFAQRLEPGDRILTSVSEYASNCIAYLQVARRTGARVEAVPNDADGRLSIPAAEAMIAAGRVRLIAITHVPTNGGLVNPAAELGRLARAARIPYLLDACQSVGQQPIDVEAIGCDFLSATARKYLRGPRGIGFLYVREPWITELEPPFLDLHAATWTGPDRFEIRGDARRFENWESHVAGRVALGVAADYAMAAGLDAIAARVQWLAARLRDRLQRIDGVEVRDLGAPAHRCGIVSFTCAGLEAPKIQAALRARDVFVSSSRASSTPLDMTGRGLAHLVRASVHYYNTEDEIERFCAAIDDLRPGSRP
ncbi:MAG: aminotransferase class V-fold PLP-dependent enzyme [Lautropia sp.]